MTTEIGKLASLSKSESDERKVKSGKGRIGGRRLRVRLPDVVVVHVKVRRVGRRTHFRDVGCGLARYQLPVNTQEPVNGMCNCTKSAS